MERALRKADGPAIQLAAQKQPVKPLQDLSYVDIYYIGAIGFYQNIVQPRTTVFTTSLYEIDKLLKEQMDTTSYLSNRENKELTDKQLVDLKLPPQYREFKDVFSKAASDVLLLY